MRNVQRIVILYPGETSSKRINTPGNYSLSRLLIQLHASDAMPVHFLNWSGVHETYGNIEFVHFTAFGFLKLAARLAFKRGTLIISQMGAYTGCARMLRAIMPGSRILVRLGGVYYGAEYIKSEAFRSRRKKERRRLLAADMIVSTADGTPVDLYMRELGIPQDRYRKLLNGFPEIPNATAEKRGNRILCISRLSPEKGIDYVLRSFAAAIPRLNESYTLTIVGNGSERDALQSLARELGVATAVEFVGESYDIAAHLYGSKLLLSGLSNNTIMEAIATGTPVVGVELGEVKALYGQFRNVRIVDYPPGGCGRIAPAHMAELVRRTADAVVEMLNQADAHISRDNVRSRPLYSWQQRLQTEIELYESLLAPREDPDSARSTVAT